MATPENKKSSITVEIAGDNSKMMSALDEIENKIDLINSKLERMLELSGQAEKVFTEDCPEDC